VGLWEQRNRAELPPYGQRREASATHLEVANAAPPVRVNQRSASQRFAQTFLRGGIEQSQSGNEIETFQGGNESVGGNLRNAPDLLFNSST